MAAPSASCGYVFATSGQGYSDLAVRAAQTLRAVSPDANIDLFCDVQLDGAVFDHVHPLERSWFRPKFEALRRSRFEKTIYLDADLYVLAPIDDVFDVLDRFDIALAHDQRRSGTSTTRMWRRAIPAAFPQLNGGLFAARATAEFLQLLQDAENHMLAEDLPRDQMALRELIFDSDLRLAVLPPEYNLMDYLCMAAQWGAHGAPRILHHSAFREHVTDGVPITDGPEALLGPWLYAHANALIAADISLGKQRNPKLKPHPAIEKLVDSRRKLRGTYNPDHVTKSKDDMDADVTVATTPDRAELQEKIRSARRDARETMRTEWQALPLRKRISRAIRGKL